MEETCVEAMDVATIFSLIWQLIEKKTNCLVWEMTLLHCLAEIKEMTIGETTFGILYGCLQKVVVTLWGLNSYTIVIAQKSTP